jgi:hypothetical protein
MQKELGKEVDIEEVKLKLKGYLKHQFDFQFLIE